MAEPWFVPLHVDLLKEEPALQDCSVDLVVTSPPYKRKDGYTPALMEALGRLLGRVMRPGARCFLNFGQLRESFTRPFEARALVEEHSGLTAGQTIAWVKSIALPQWKSQLQALLDRTPADVPICQSVIRKILDGNGEVLSRGHSSTISHRSPIMTYCWEPIFTFYKPPELPLDRFAIGCAYADKSNLTRGTRGQHGDIKCAGDTWFVPYKTTGAKTKKASAKTAHAYGFPEALVERCIKVANIAPGSDVYDPFMGSGTVAVVAKRLGMNSYGTERDLSAIAVAEARWNIERVSADAG